MFSTTRIGREDVLPVVCLFAHLFLTAASIVTGKAARDAIFLTRFTALQMTAVDLMTMIAVALAIAVQLRLNARVPMRRLLLVSPLCFAIGDAGLWIGVSTSHLGWLTWVAYLWIGVQASFGAPQASVLTNHVLSIRQAKGLYSLVGAGAILGWIGGGLVTARLSTHLGAASLLLVAGLLTAVCPAIVSVAWREDAPTPAGRRSADPVSTRHNLRRSAWLVWSSPHLRAIAALALVSSAVTTIAGLQFKVIASRSVSGPDHLAAFFGSFNLHAGLLALVAQLLLGQVIGRVGFGLALAVAPCALAAGSASVLCSGTLAAAMFLKGSDQVLRYSVDRMAIESLYRPLPEREIFEGKTFIDALVCRFGDAAGAILAMLALVFLHLSFAWLSMISLGLLPAWFAAAEIARRRYRTRLIETLRQRLSESSGPETNRIADFRKVRSVDRGALDPRELLDPNPAIRLQVLASLSRRRDHRPLRRHKEKLLLTALAAEIVGFAVLIETASRRHGSTADERRETREAIERVSKLLSLLAPNRYPSCVWSALRADDTATRAVALEYLDITLTSPHRQLLIPALDRWALAV